MRSSYRTTAGGQLDGAPASLEALPAIRREVGPNFPLLLDGGIRSGEDIAKAIVAGADFALVGRAVMYGVAASADGAAQAIGLLKTELSQTCAQLGVTSIDGLDGQYAFNAGGHNDRYLSEAPDRLLA